MDENPARASAAAQDLVATAAQGPITTLTLNDPAKRNALSLPMMRALTAALERVAADPQCRAVVLASTGTVFSAGHDLAELRGAPESAAQELFDTCAQLMLLIQRIPQPVIARVQGLATAAGCQLAATCDLAVAAQGASFATPGVRIGLFCSTPMVALSRAVDRKTALRMLLTGEALSAEDALVHGLVSHVVPAEQLEARAHEVAAQVASASGATVALGKRAFYAQAELPTAEAYEQMARVMTANAGLGDAQEGIGAFLDKRAPVWQHRGAAATP